MESPATGHVYGSVDKWIGLGIFFDSFDNDNKHNNPYIMAMTNDGTKLFDHQNDGSTQQLAGCLRDFRNKPFPVRAKIEYFRNTLTLLFHNGMSNNDKDFEMCVRAENVVLPKTGYFGVSAATGGLADDHDVLKLVTHSLRSPDMALTPDHVDQEESRKFETEFKEFQTKNEQQKKEWVEANPEKAKAMKQVVPHPISPLTPRAPLASPCSPHHPGGGGGVGRLGGREYPGAQADIPGDPPLPGPCYSMLGH